MVTTTAYAIAAQVPDPELPQLTLEDLGILRGVDVDGDTVTATITPTYSGCPAMREISEDLTHRLRRAGYRDVRVRQQLTPAWTSDWITEPGRAKLTAAGIAPPHAAPTRSGRVPLTLTSRARIACPYCGSQQTTQTAQFSGTACKALHRCSACHEPFESVKAI
ncbi:MAG TPA: 1,2-phenylacetyl-CoA epoxidase subunit PaaD [Jatrophihabitans sp.]